MRDAQPFGDAGVRGSHTRILPPWYQLGYCGGMSARSAVTGRFVAAAHAFRHPDTTVVETGAQVARLKAELVLRDREVLALRAKLAKAERRVRLLAAGDE